jgi:uncharacterized membrane protein
MLLRLLTGAALAFSTVWAQNGPSSLYALLNGVTFNPPGYTIVMYQSCVQNQNAGNPCGSFSGFQSAAGQYTHMLYGPEAPVSPSCSRTFKLALACGPALVMSGVSENPTCVYSATLTLPQVCGVDLTVGNEVSSVSPTALPPTSSPTGTPTVTASTTTTLTATPTSTISATSTPLFQITAWPTTSSTMTLTATSTPLFMITAWPTTSPVNVSATSTPLYYYTAYPSVGSNATGSGLLGFAASLTGSGSSTSVIIGSVALGIVGLAAVGGAVAYFRNGGTLGGFMNKLKSQKGAMTQFANALPISDAQKAKLTGAIADPSSLIPEAQRAQLEQAKAKLEELTAQAQQAKESVLHVLPPSIAEAVRTKEEELTAQAKAAVQAHILAAQQKVLSFAPVAPAAPAAPVAPAAPAAPAHVAPAPVAAASHVEPAAEPLPADEAPSTSAPVHIAVNAEDVKAIQAFLAEKAEKEKSEA